MNRLQRCVFCFVLLGLWLSGCSEMNDEKGEPGDFIPPKIIVLYSDRGLPSNSKLLMQVISHQSEPRLELNSIFVLLPLSDDSIKGEVTINGNLAWWTPDRELPLGPHPLSITAIDRNGGTHGRGDIFVHFPGDSFHSLFPARIVVVEPDQTPPILINTQLPQGAVGVPLVPTFEFTFSESILAHHASVRLEPTLEDPLSFVPLINLDSKEPLSVIHLRLLKAGSKLSPNTTYTLLIEGIEDLAGNKADPMKLEFTTATIGLQ